MTTKPTFVAHIEGSKATLLAAHIDAASRTKRESLAQSCLTSQFKMKYPDCHESIMWSLSPEVYRARSAMVKTRCGTFSDSQL